jgi:hypothetical protein
VEATRVPVTDASMPRKRSEGETNERAGYERERETSHLENDPAPVEQKEDAVPETNERDREGE